MMWWTPWQHFSVQTPFWPAIKAKGEGAGHGKKGRFPSRAFEELARPRLEALPLQWNNAKAQLKGRLSHLWTGSQALQPPAAREPPLGRDYSGLPHCDVQMALLPPNLPTDDRPRKGWQVLSISQLLHKYGNVPATKQSARDTAGTR